ncbi:urease accessory protein UreF [Synechococcus sp. ROS8604]|jgi:urease accessory protein|uniref:urease accessory protein UreF n=1 Tax=Synechococcus sp. ROS8604 TaxID=1442557 RepID=UPI0016493A21|nr:urease accessory UreF family protein [Synechococcus sp. ROS8604]NKB75031.1 urease accessory protein UreF [Synechococcus sp. s2_metabat2_7]QNI90305.1 urease accessory protein UreF [Synechococcus sp. ROS8604]
MTSLALLQLVSPALPVGAFSYSEGLEVLIQNGSLIDELDLQHWIEAELQRGALRLEAAALNPLRVQLQRWEQERSEMPSELMSLDGWLLALRESAEVRAQQGQMGGSLLQLMVDLGHPLPQPVVLAWPAAWAWAALSLKISELEMVEGYLYGWVANQLSAAVRLVPLGPTTAQRIQQQLLPMIREQASVLKDQDPYTLWCGGAGAGLAQLAHAELYSRLFRS